MIEGMGTFTYNGDSTRVYPDITVNGAVLVAESGKSYDLESSPDALWSSVTSVQTAPESPVEPATPSEV